MKEIYIFDVNIKETRIIITEIRYLLFAFCEFKENNNDKDSDIEKDSDKDKTIIYINNMKWNVEFINNRVLN